MTIPYTQFLLVAAFVLFTQLLHIYPCLSLSPQYKTTTLAGSMFLDTISDVYALSEYVPLSQPSAAVMNEKNESFVADTIHHVIRVLYPNSTSRVYAGLGTAGFNGDGMHALLTQFHTPIGLSLTPNGDLYVADSGNGRVRKISASTRIVTTLISNQELSTPVGVFAMMNGDVYVTDSTKGLVKHFHATTGKVSLVAGGGSVVVGGGLATSMKLISPYGIHVTPQGVIFITELRSGYSVVWKIEGPQIGMQQIIQVAGNIQGMGTKTFYENSQPWVAFFSALKGIFVRSNGDILVADYGLNAVRTISITNGIVTTFAGDGRNVNDGENVIPTKAAINQPAFIYEHSNGDVVITGADHVKLVSKSTGTISTVWGKYNDNNRYGDGLRSTALGAIVYPNHVAVSKDNGEIYFTDSNASTIRKISQDGILTTIAGIPKKTGYPGLENVNARETLLSAPTCLHRYENGEILFCDAGSRLRRIQLNGNVTTVFYSQVTAVFPTGQSSTTGFIYCANSAFIFKINATTSSMTIVYNFAGNTEQSTKSFHVVDALTDGPILYFAEYGTNSIFKYFENNSTKILLYNGTNDLSISSIAVQNDTLYFVHGSSTIRALSLRDGSVRIIAGIAPDSNGNEFAGYNGDGLKATESLISTPTSLFLTAQGEIYFVEQTVRIRKISVDGILSTVAGRFQYDASSKAPQSANSTYLNTINSISFVKNKDSKSGGDIWIHSVDSFYNSYLLSKVDIKNGYLSRLSGFRIYVNGVNAFEGLLKNVLVTGLVSTCGFSNGDVIIAARQYHVLYKYVAATGLVSIIAGTFRQSSSPPTEGLASQSLLASPRVPMCFDNGDILFIQGALGMSRISKYIAATESIVFLANVTAIVNGAAISPFTGDLYFVEQTTSTVKMKNFTSGEISIIAGNGYSGYNGEDVLATEASLRNPQSLVFLKNGDLVISDSGNGLIRKVSKETKRIVTIGGMIPGSETCNYNGDGRLSTQTCAGLPTTIVSGGNGELYYADQTFGLVRKMIPFCEGNRTLDNETFLECICLNGWSGSNCEIPSCNGTWANDIRVCSGNGQCKSLDSCQCQNGFEGPLCERTSLRQNTDAIIIGVVVGVGGCLILSALVIVVIVIASYLTLRRGKNSKNSEVNIENGNKGISHISTLNSVELETNFSSSDFPSDASVSFTPLMTENGSGTVSAEARGQAIDPFSRYQNIVKIGQGAFGSVFKANDTKYGNKAKAVKVMKFSSMSELNSIMKEGIQLMNIRHDNILKVNDIFLSKDQLLCLDMDYYEKGDLNKFTTLAPGHAVECNEKIVKQVIYQICTALVYVHGTLNIIHRDIKPSNIFIQSFDEKKQQIRVVLADFGLAKGNQGSEAQSYAGTPLYMSPEIGLGSKYYANTDVYSLGVTVYQMMTKDTATSISHLLLTKEPSVSKQILKNKILENDYSEELANIVLQMLEKESVTRPNAQDILSLPYFNK